MKWLFRIVVVIIVLLIVGVGVLFLALNGIVKGVVQSQGTQQLKVPTTLSGVNLGIFKGTVDLDNFALGSPAGFSAPQMFSVSKLAVETGGLGHLRSEPIHISTIDIDAPLLVVEESGGKINFRELINGLPSNPDKGTTPTTSTGKPATKLVIDALTMTNAHVKFQGSLPGISKSLDVPLPTMTMQNIGNADGSNNGAAIKDVAVAVITKMVAQATHSKEVPAALQVLLSGDLGSVQAKLTGAAQGELSKLKVPAGVGGLLNQVTGGNADKSKDASGDPVNGLINQGLGALGGGKK